MNGIRPTELWSGTSIAAARAGAARRMAAHEVAQVRAAAEHARRAVAGPLGELAARELVAYAELGYCGHRDALVPRLARQVLALPRRSPDTAA